MNKGIQWSQDDLDRYKARQKKANGEPEFENEDAFQAKAEKALKAGGFRKRTKKDIKENETGLWYEHRPKTKAQGQAIIADLFIWNSNNGRYIEIELKNENNDLSPEQRFLYARNEITLCKNWAEFIKTVTEFLNNDKGESK